jgi:hypothetical protein
MNGADLAQRIRLYEGAGFEPEREEKSPLAGMLLYALALVGGGAAVGIGYCIFQAWTALHG